MDSTNENKKKPGRPRKYPIDYLAKKKSGKSRRPTRVKPSITCISEITSVSDNELKNYLRRLDSEIIFAAIQGAEEHIMDKILSNVAKRTLFKYEMHTDINPDKYKKAEVAKAREILISPFYNR